MDDASRPGRSITTVLIALSLFAAQLLPDAAFAESCDGVRDDAEVASCVGHDLKSKIDAFGKAHERLSEALGPRAAAGLPDEQSAWLKRVAGYCGIPQAENLESLENAGLDVARTLCLERFIVVRTYDLGERLENAKEIAEAFASRDYPSVPATWGDRLNPDKKAPMGRFSAYYLRSGNPAELISTDTVDEVSINYAWSDLHGIKSEDFEGYWVGQFRYKKETPVYIAVDQSWSRTRVIVDRKLIYEGSSNARVPFVFSPGTHMVEVEYVNNWHTTGMSVAFLEAAEPVARSELRGRLRAIAPENSVVQYVGVYESGSQDNAISLDLSPSSVPVILVLNSYSAVRWVVNNPDRVDVRAVVYSAYSPGSRIQLGKDNGRIPRILVEGGLGSYDASPRCNCIGGLFHCEGGSLASTVQGLAGLLGYPVSGFSGGYSPKTIAVPGIVVTPEVLTNARAVLERLGNDRGECRKTRELHK